MTFDGFPLGYEVFAGNTHDARTLQTIVATMEARHGMLGRVWITDRGMASTENLTWLRQTGRRYIIGAPKSELKKFGAELTAAGGWRTVHEGVEVKLVRHPETEETVILCRSADRRSKEKAMHDKFSRRIETALDGYNAQRSQHLRVHDFHRVGGIEAGEGPLGRGTVRLDSARELLRQATEEEYGMDETNRTTAVDETRSTPHGWSVPDPLHDHLRRVVRHVIEQLVGRKYAFGRDRHASGDAAQPTSHQLLLRRAQAVGEDRG